LRVDRHGSVVAVRGDQMLEPPQKRRRVVVVVMADVVGGVGILLGRLTH
jgi:hypothetical protein